MFHYIFGEADDEHNNDNEGEDDDHLSQERRRRRRPQLFAKGSEDFLPSNGRSNGEDEETEGKENNFVKGVKWSPDGYCFLSNSDDNLLRIFWLNQEILDYTYYWPFQDDDDDEKEKEKEKKEKKEKEKEYEEKESSSEHQMSK
jgi:WD40 repeat protein